MSVEEHMRRRLGEHFAPQHLELANESHQHSVPADSETHFRLVLVADAFRGQRRVARHQQVYGLLQEFLDGPVHALALHLYDPEEWAAKSAPTPASPPCLGGSKQD